MDNPRMTEERRELHRIAKKAACEAGLPLHVWLQLNGLPHNATRHEGLPNLCTVYGICDAAGVKVSDYFGRLGR